MKKTESVKQNTNTPQPSGADSTAVKPSKKFIGLRVDGDKAEQLQDLADTRGVSLNELLNSLIDELQDPGELAVENVNKGMNQQQDKADDLHKNLDRIAALIKLQDHLGQKRADLDSTKPDGIFASVFEAERLENWNSQAKDLEDKYKRLSAKIEALLTKVIEPDGDRPSKFNKPALGTGDSDIQEDTTELEDSMPSRTSMQSARRARGSNPPKPEQPVKSFIDSIFDF